MSKTISLRLGTAILLNGLLAASQAASIEELKTVADRNFINSVSLDDAEVKALDRFIKGFSARLAGKIAPEYKESLTEIQSALEAS